MTAQISVHLDNYLAYLLGFRFAYFTAREKLASQRGKEINLAEFAILHSKGGRRLPLWIRSIHDEPKRNGGTPARSDGLINKYDLRDFYDSLVEQISRYKIVPKTRIETLASYLAGQVSARVSTLADFAGIGTSTARNWLRLCAEHQILEPFHTMHESFFLNVRLIELTIDGNLKSSAYFEANFAKDLAALRKRRDWIAESPIGYFYGQHDRVF